MYKVFCDNARLRLFFDDEIVKQSHVKTLNNSSIEQCVETINSWLESFDKKDLDLYIKDSLSVTEVLDQIFDWHYAAGGVVLIDDKILSIVRNGIPDLPKGHIDPGENAEKAAMREVCEETGLGKPEINRQLPTTYHCYQMNNSWILKKTSWFLMQASADFEPIPQLYEGISAVELLEKKELEAFFSKTYRSISEELSQDIRLKNKFMQ